MANKTNSAARFTRRYTDAQKQALLRAVVLDGHTVAEARKMARNGTLGVPAFELSTTAYTIVRDNREQLEASNETALALAIQRELHDAELDALAHLRATRQSFKRDASGNPEPMRRATQALTAIQKARRDAQKPGAKPKPAANTQTPEPTNTPAADDTVAELLKLRPKDARTGSLNDASKPPNAA